MRPVLLMLLIAAGCASPDVGFDGRTTDGALARANLEARLRALGALEERGSPNPAVASERIEARLMRARYFGTHGDLTAALASIDDASTNPARLTLYARVAGAAHQFDRAARLLDQAEALDGQPRAQERSTIDLATRRDLDRVLADRVRTAAAYPSYGALVDVAAAYAAKGRFEDADRAYRRALALYGDVSPFPVAYVQFQRGVMWSEMAGQPERAIPLYRDAVERLPDYVVANVHLAELESPDEAITRLTRVVAVTDDPEPASLLAELLAERDPAAAARHERRATETYGRLLETLPEAYADHAAEHFLGPGADPDRAWRLAHEQLNARSTDRHVQLAIDAALASGRSDAACDLAELGRARARVPLRELSRRVLAACPAR